VFAACRVTGGRTGRHSRNYYEVENMNDKPTALIHGAAKVLGITGEITAEIVTAAYRRAAMKYHPDRNPAGLVMMKAVNAARLALADFVGTLNHAPEAANYGGDLNDAIAHLLHSVGLDLEICGAWLWVSGETKAHKDTIKGFSSESGNKFRWHSKKVKWYFAPNDYKGRRRFRGSVDMEDIRERYGSAHVQTQGRTALHGAA